MASAIRLNGESHLTLFFGFGLFSLGLGAGGLVVVSGRVHSLILEGILFRYNNCLKMRVYTLKTIQMTIDDDLLQRVDNTVQAIASNRSAFIHKALELALRHYAIQQLERQDAIGYMRTPAGAEEVQEWLPEQAWGDEWNEGK